MAHAKAFVGRENGTSELLDVVRQRNFLTNGTGNSAQRERVLSQAPAKR